MVKTKRVYRWCEGCDRRIAEELFAASRCPGCHSDIKRRMDRASRPLTEDEYSELENMLPGVI